MQAVEALCRVLQIEPVRADAFSDRTPIGVLLGTADAGSRPAGQVPGEEQKTPSPIREEMIVMSGLSDVQFHALLDGLKEMSLHISLKDVETLFNRGWTGEMLQAELISERQALGS